MAPTASPTATTEHSRPASTRTEPGVVCAALGFEMSSSVQKLYHLSLLRLWLSCNSRLLPQPQTEATEPATVTASVCTATHATLSTNRNQVL
jgi:hypothetical protein